MKKKILLFLLALLPLMANADPIEINGIYYRFSSSGGTKTAIVTENPTFYSGDIVIPESVTYKDVNYRVTSIDYSAFSDCENLTSVMIPNSVTSILDGAFANCMRLTSLSIPSSVTFFGKDAFWGCTNLTSFTIPNSVTSIGDYCFRYCYNLNSITIPKSVSSIGKAIFAGCGHMSSIVVEADNTVYDSRDNCNAIIETASGRLLAGCNSTVIPNGVTSIAYGAFDRCIDMLSVAIPNSVTSIGENAFMDCMNMESLTIPKSVTSIGDAAFARCGSLMSIVVEAGNTVYDSRDNCNAIIETANERLIAGCNISVIPNGVTSIGKAAFDGCMGLTSMTIPNSVTSIEYEAFARCHHLTSVTIPNSVTSIGEGAFIVCMGLTSLTIPNSVTSIDNFAFALCSGLTSVTIGSNVTSIGHRILEGCDNLQMVKSLSVTPPIVQDDTFSNYDITLYVPAGSIEAYKAAEPWKNFKEIVALTDEVANEDVIKISSAGQSTWCSAYDLDFTNVEGLKAYIASGYHRTKGTIWLTRVKEVPAGEGFLLIGEEGEYKVPHLATTAYYANLMVGTVKAITINEKEGDYTNYYLSNGDYGVGFYKVNGTQAISANRAYLPLLKGNVPAGTRFISLGFEDGEGTTGIKEVKSGEVKGEKWFTLQGQRVLNPGKGLYIKNGKKVLVK